MATSTSSTNNPAEAQGAQIALDSFTVPEFPPSARDLQALTLLSAIKAEQYQSLLSGSFVVPALPSGLRSLTLELFSLGYPPGFLTALASRVPLLSTFVAYSQILDGVTSESQRDAVESFKALRSLRALHLLDTFVQPGFCAKVGPWVKWNTSELPQEARRGLMFLEASYTYRSEDAQFMSKIQGTELPSLIGPGLISLSFNISTPEASDEAPAGQAPSDASVDGIMAFNQPLSEKLVRALTDGEEHPVGLKALNTTLYTLSLEQLKAVTAAQKNVMHLVVTVAAEPGESWKAGLLEAVKNCAKLQVVEIVVHPSVELLMELQSSNSGAFAKTFPSKDDMTSLSKGMENLARFGVSILRCSRFQTLDWTKKDGTWTGGVNAAAARP